MPTDHIRGRMSKKYDIDHRAALFGSHYSTRKAEEQDPELGGDTSHLERENDSHIRDLSSKVDTLKSISLSIQGAVRESSSILSGMGDQFDSATRVVKSTVGKISTLIHSKTGHHMWHFVLFIAASFILLYLLFHK